MDLSPIIQTHPFIPTPSFCFFRRKKRIGSLRTRITQGKSKGVKKGPRIRIKLVMINPVRLKKDKNHNRLYHHLFPQSYLPMIRPNHFHTRALTQRPLERSIYRGEARRKEKNREFVAFIFFLSFFYPNSPDPAGVRTEGSDHSQLTGDGSSCMFGLSLGQVEKGRTRHGSSFLFRAGTGDVP